MPKMIATSSRQLGLCLKLLYAEKESFSVSVCKNDKQKIEYQIDVNTNKKRMAELEEKYKILSS